VYNRYIGAAVLALVLAFIPAAAPEAQPLLGDSWQSVAHSASNFGGGGTMTWTVDAADQETYSYVISGNRMTVAWAIWDSAVSGGDWRLKLKIPGGKTAARFMSTMVFVNQDGSRQAGLAYVGYTNNDWIEIINVPGTNYPTGSMQTEGQITFEIN